MEITIQINNLDALMHLLEAEDDGELKINIRHSVIEAFGHSFVKSVANTEAVAAEMQKINEEVQKKIDEKISDITIVKSWEGRISLKPDIRTLISVTVREAIQEEVREQLIALDMVEVVSRLTEQNIKAHVDATTKKLITQELQKLVQSRLDGLFNEVGNG